MEFGSTSLSKFNMDDRFNWEALLLGVLVMSPELLQNASD
jgi:hypothetical protein